MTRDGPPPRPAIRPGLCLDGFTLTGLLGRGGQGVVWEATQDHPERRVALKLLDPGLVLGDAGMLARFDREGRAAGRVSHRALVTVLAVGEAQGIPYIAQELVPGGRTLVDLIHEARAAIEQPPDHYVTIARLFADVAEALHAAHEQGVLHRDVKPSNVLLTPEGHPKLADFGLAKLSDEHTVSHEQSLMGTPYYMSPEQVRGGAVDRRSDVFALGVALYEALTFTRPFDADSRSGVFGRILLAEPVDPRRLRRSIPPELEMLCMKALDKEPARRFATAGELAAELQRFVNHQPLRTRPPGWLGRVRRWTRQHRVAAAAGLVGLLGLAGIATALLFFVQERAARYRNEIESTRAQGRELEAQRALAIERAALAEEQRDRALAQADLMSESQRIVGHLLAQLDETDALFARAMDALTAGGDAEQAEQWRRAYVDADLGTARLFERMRRASAHVPDPDTRRERLFNVGIAAGAHGLLAPAAEMLEEVVALSREQLGNEDEHTRMAIYELALVRRELGGTDLVVAETLLRELLALERDPARRRMLRGELAVVLAGRGRWDEAEAIIAELLPADASGFVRDVGGLHVLQTYAALLIEREWLDEAQRVLDRGWAALEIVDADEGDRGLQHGLQGRALEALARVRAEQDDPRAAAELLDQAIGHLRLAVETLTPIGHRERPMLFEAQAGLGLALAQRGDVGEAIPLLERAAFSARRLYGERHEDTALVRSNLALAYQRADRDRDALGELADVVAWSGDQPREVNEGTLFALYNLAAMRILAFEESADVAALDEAYAYARVLVEHTSPSHPRYSKRREMLSAIESRRP